MAKHDVTASLGFNDTQKLALFAGIIAAISTWISTTIFGIPNSFLFGLGAGAIVGVVAFASRGLSVAGAVIAVLVAVVALANSGS